MVYNVIVIPMETGLTLESSVWRSTFETVVDILFAIDICLNLVTGYINEVNKLVMDSKLIAKRYIKSWFFIDIFATLPFEVIASVFNIDAG